MTINDKAVRDTRIPEGESDDIALNPIKVASPMYAREIGLDMFDNANPAKVQMAALCT